MKSISLTAIAIVVILSACQNTASTDAAQKKAPLSLEDSLYKSVIALHDEAMPKLGKMMGYEKILQVKIDSLQELLKTRKDASAKTLAVRYDSLLVQLKAAEKGMNEWMDSFEPDPKLPNKQELENYWQDQQQKAQQMRDGIMNAMDSAKAHLP